MTLEPYLVELGMVQAAEGRRRAPECSNKPELRIYCVDDQIKLCLPHEIKAILGFTLHLGERNACGEQQGVQGQAAVRCKYKVTHSVRDLDALTHHFTAI